MGWDAWDPGFLEDKGAMLEVQKQGDEGSQEVLGDVITVADNCCVRWPLPRRYEM